MGGRVSNIGAARRFPRWEGHWKTPTDQPMAAGSRSECTRRESAAKRSAIWDRMAGETRCEHSYWEFLAMVAMRTKGQLGNANFSSFSWRSEPGASAHVRSSPSACLRRRGNRFAVPRILMGKSSKRRISRPRAHGGVAGPQGDDWPHSQPIDLLPEGGAAWGPEEVASRGLGCSSRKCVPCVRMGRNFRQEREYGHREAGAMSERSSRVYTRRGILDKRALVVRWMSKVALRVYTRDVFSNGGGPLGGLEASLMSGSASHVYTRDALPDGGQLSAAGCPVVRPCAREEALPQQRARGQNDWFRPRAVVSLP